MNLKRHFSLRLHVVSCLMVTSQESRNDQKCVSSVLGTCASQHSCSSLPAHELVLFCFEAPQIGTRAVKEFSAAE